MTLKRILVTLKSIISDKLALTGALIMNVAPCSDLLSKTPLFRMVVLTLKVMLHPWQFTSIEILIRGFQKGKT